MPMEPKLPIRTACLYDAGKLKAHKYFGQGNKFQGSFKLLAAQHMQKSMGLPVYFSNPSSPSSILPLPHQHPNHVPFIKASFIGHVV